MKKHSIGLGAAVFATILAAGASLAMADSAANTALPASQTTVTTQQPAPVVPATTTKTKTSPWGGRHGAERGTRLSH